LSTCHTVYISVLILFMIMSQLIINTYVSLMYKLKKMKRYLRVNLLGPGPRLMQKEFTGPRSQRLRNTGIENKIQARLDTSTVGTSSVMAETVLHNAASSVVIQQKYRHSL